MFFRKVKFEKSIAPVFVSCSAKQQPRECVLVLVLVKYGTIKGGVQSIDDHRRCIQRRVASSTINEWLIQRWFMKASARLLP